MSEVGFTRYRSLSQKVVVITGGASGIGEILVQGFSEQGAHVHFLDIDTKGGQAVALQTSASFHACDLTDIGGLRNALSHIEADAGRIDVLINNAANDDRHDMLSVEPEYWRDRLAINLDHQFFACQAVARGMKARKYGSIILTSSTSFKKGRPGMVGYTTAKAAIAGLTRSLARELGGDGIRVNCLVPGAISTPRQKSLWRDDKAEREIERMQALKIDLQASDVANMALFLASDDARGCTGGEYLVDAGISL